MGPSSTSALAHMEGVHPYPSLSYMHVRRPWATVSSSAIPLRARQLEPPPCSNT